MAVCHNLLPCLFYALEVIIWEDTNAKLFYNLN